MGENSKIEWTDGTWNPIRGCSRVSEGCRNCYAESHAARFSGHGLPFEGLAEFKNHDARWTGAVRLIEKQLTLPLRWKRPMRIFVNSMSDLFHSEVRTEWLARIFDVMARAPHHTYQILTKRPERMLESLRPSGLLAEDYRRSHGESWPPANWWFGVSIEDQESANRRLPLLAQTPAAVRIVSYEPALGPVNFPAALDGDASDLIALDWVIVGGESGAHARPFDPNWARAVRDVCMPLEIPFFMKQMGGRKSHNDLPIPPDLKIRQFPQVRAS